MNLKHFSALGATTIAMAMPTMALASKPDTTGKDKPKPTAAQTAKKLCKVESKKRTQADKDAGLKGTAFSRCVKAAKQAAQTADEDATVSPKKAAKQACKTGFAKKRTQADKDAGLKGTAYSRCIVAAAHANKDEKADDDSMDDTDTDTDTETETETQS